MLHSFIILAAVTAATVSATPAPGASNPPSIAASGSARTDVDPAPIAHARKRKELPRYGYMKQANDDPQGLSRLQDQLRQLRPQL